MIGLIATSPPSVVISRANLQDDAIQELSDNLRSEPKSASRKPGARSMPTSSRRS